MAVFDPIPMPKESSQVFKDVMDYLEKIKERRSKEPYYNALAKHAESQANRENKLAELPFAGRELPGAAGKALGLQMIKGQYGEESPEYLEAKKLYDLDMARAEQTMEYQKSLIESQPKRYATAEGKRALEQQEIEQGIMPGSSIGNRPGKPLTPEQQQKLKGQYKLKTLKDTTDTGVRQRILYSKNMEKTLNNLNVDDLTSYSGIQGTGELLKDKAKSLRGDISPRYQKYKNALTAAETLAKQVRQFYGDSITAGVQEGLKKLTNPTNWLEHPKVAKSRFNAFKNILQTEAKTFTDAAKNADIYEEEKPSGGNVLTYNQETGEFE
jgi:hypothetical protein